MKKDIHYYFILLKISNFSKNLILNQQKKNKYGSHQSDQYSNQFNFKVITNPVQMQANFYSFQISLKFNRILTHIQSKREANFNSNTNQSKLNLNLTQLKQIPFEIHSTYNSNNTQTYFKFNPHSIQI